MALFQRLFFAVLLAGLLSGAAMAALHQWRVVPLIIAAEAHEGEAAHDHVTAEMHEHDAATPAHDHAGDEWAPQDGFERTFYTVAADVLSALGFAFVLSAAAVLMGSEVTARSGALWGIAGFAVFQFAPAFGLPPELPGMPAADVTARQVWWLATAAATATAIFGVVKFRNWPAVALAAILVLLPHVIGAPQPADHASGVPAPLAAAFAANTLFTGAVFWLILGSSYGWLAERLARPAAKAVAA